MRSVLLGCKFRVPPLSPPVTLFAGLHSTGTGAETSVRCFIPACMINITAVDTFCTDCLVSSQTLLDAMLLLT
jgi:hypothetical protein